LKCLTQKILEVESRLRLYEPHLEREAGLGGLFGF